MGGFFRGDTSAFFHRQSLSRGQASREGLRHPVVRAVRFTHTYLKCRRRQAGETNRGNLPALSLQQLLKLIENLMFLLAEGLGLEFKCQIVRHDFLFLLGRSYRLSRLSIL